MSRRPSLLILIIAALAIVAVALPALAASPSPGPGKSDQAGKDKTPKATVTLSGSVAASKNADGETTYTMVSGGTTYTLEAGPSWFFGDNHPLKASVGKSVTVVGEKADGSNTVDVVSVDGKALREPGKPPWAGGWKAVGPKHPGWSQEKADRFKAKFGDCFPPGKCKVKPQGSPTP